MYPAPSLVTSRRQSNGFLLIWLTLASSVLSLTATQAYPTAANLNLFTGSNNKLEAPTLNGNANQDLSGGKSEQELSSSGVSVVDQAGQSIPLGSSSLADDKGFHQFISSGSKPESTIIGEFKPNASALEIMLLKNRIANTILSMQEMDKHQSQTAAKAASALPPPPQAECYIEVTRVEKVPGKCHRARTGLPICQSENYMTISNDCN